MLSCPILHSMHTSTTMLLRKWLELEQSWIYARGCRYQHNAGLLGRLIWNCYCSFSRSYFSPWRRHTHTHTLFYYPLLTHFKAVWANILQASKGVSRHQQGMLGSEQPWLRSGGSHCQTLPAPCLWSLYLQTHIVESSTSLLRHSLTPKPKPQCHMYVLTTYSTCEM